MNLFGHKIEAGDQLFNILHGYLKVIKIDWLRMNPSDPETSEVAIIEMPWGEYVPYLYSELVSEKLASGIRVWYWRDPIANQELSLVKPEPKRKVTTLFGIDSNGNLAEIDHGQFSSWVLRVDTQGSEIISIRFPGDVIYDKY